MKVLYALLLLLSVIALPAYALQVAAEQPAKYLPLLKEKRVAAVVNQTSQALDGHLVDFLLSEDINLIKIMAPEHGFRGKQAAGETVIDNIDTKTGLPVVSLYGKNKKPSPDMLSDVDVLLFDIQDVGTRFYTYISTLHYVMEAAAENDVTVVVLDRPNPNGAFVDGPVRQPGFTSFVGVDPLPLLHGMTVAELALMIKGEGWINQAERLTLHTVAVENYSRNMAITLPVPPSPNLPNATAVRLYPSLCLFEGTTVSVGRGTPYPFQIIGHNNVRLGDLTITPEAVDAAPSPKLEGTELMARDLRQSAMKGFDISLLINTYQQFVNAGETFFSHPDFFDKLAGTDELRKAMVAGQDAATIRKQWQPELDAFKKRRAPYLLY
ncbi:exo-beta-N-acetylmuramidase NamZ family protein [Salinimonas iocasae]|uniref:DUF1343 domain-containing protein n=1 Tax=Salinimonas iocasae TaxID=2572577 RepID=A0A5B7YH64_9ALTE|nr:DUF1343 domain-containing protein [Salinimonas iocasae]QCZ94716.1 DUF1343 domain-containing protein [Salinimonas iocasae]